MDAGEKAAEGTAAHSREIAMVNFMMVVCTIPDFGKVLVVLQYDAN